MRNVTTLGAMNDEVHKLRGDIALVLHSYRPTLGEDELLLRQAMREYCAALRTEDLSRAA